MNEVKNIRILLEEINDATKNLPVKINKLFIDNASTDGTVDLLEQISEHDKSVMVIVNKRNFGTVRSPYYGMMNAPGDAVLLMCADLQEPPSLIPDLINLWLQGAEVALAVKNQSKENVLLFNLRKIGYKALDYLTPTPIYQNATGFGIYSRKFLDEVKKINDPYPFWRGLPGELGFNVKTISFVQQQRLHGRSKNSLYTLYDSGIVGIINLTNAPIRMFSFFGILLGTFSVLLSFVYLILKIIFWDSFPIGIAPLIILILFLSGVQFFFMGLLAEYIAQIHVSIKKKPIVVEERRINFKKDS